MALPSLGMDFLPPRRRQPESQSHSSLPETLPVFSLFVLEPGAHIPEENIPWDADRGAHPGFVGPPLGEEGALSSSSIISWCFPAGTVGFAPWIPRAAPRSRDVLHELWKAEGVTPGPNPHPGTAHPHPISSQSPLDPCRDTRRTLTAKGAGGSSNLTHP